MSMNSYNKYNNNSHKINNFNSNNQSYISYDSENNILFETMLNNINEWQNNPIEATRLCLKYLYELNRIQQKNIEIIDKQKASKNELSSGLSTKGDLADIMHTFNEVAQNMEQRPTKDELLIILDEKMSEINKKILNRPSLDEIKKLLANGEIEVNLRKSFDELNKNFVNIKEFSEIMNNKISKESVINLLNEKVSKNEFDMVLNNINNIKNNENLEEKVKIIDNDLDRLIDHMKKQFNNIDNNINNLIKNKIEYKDFEVISNKIVENEKNLTNKINEDILNIKNEINLINEKYNNDNKLLNEFTNNYEKNLKINENNLIKYVENKINLIAEKINNFQIENEKDAQKNMNIINQNIDQINKKIINFEKQKFTTITDFENISLNLKSEIKDFQNYIKDYLKNSDEELINNINQKMNIEEAKEILSQKVDISTLQKMLNSKASLLEMDNLKLNFEKMNQEVENKLNNDKFDSYIEKISNNLQEIKNDLLLKSNIDEVMSYLKNKANIDDVNKALVDIHNDLDNKSSLSDFKHAMNNQNSINSYLAKENSIGKWLWETGHISKGYAVPWESQVINTMPENFIWEKDDISIIVKEKGIYLLSLAFFVKEKPTIQVIVNGENVLSQVNSNAYIVRQENINEFSNINFGFSKEDENENGYNCVTGVTMNEFLCFSNMSKIVISYSGNNSVKGMMSLKQICPL